MLTRLTDWARVLRTDVMTLYLAARDPRVPWHVKALAGLVAAYALSPIDLIPDFIPLLGLLDDVILVPLGVLFVIKLAPASVMAELRHEAETRVARPGASWLGALIVLLLWIFIGLTLVAIFFPGFRFQFPTGANA
jgi:uncharacterized membrane protein YkvA (DUF1232 family)